ncbi:MAG TPA: TfoX/Sxy family protein [Thermoplasmata archaeon]|nr:TfoX/Sxy family protein [Thermoplasmata archaeon]
MEMPKASKGAVERFHRLAPSAENVQQKLVFGHPAAFVNGNMFFGVFGDQLFVRLSEEGAADAESAAGGKPFEPMAGRPMRGYVVLPDKIWDHPEQSKRWIAKSLAFARDLPAKKAKKARK